MSTANNGGPAFPVHWPTATSSGITLRDYFAAKAMQGMFASDTDDWNEQGDWTSRAESAYEMADAMLKAREAAPQEN